MKRRNLTVALVVVLLLGLPALVFAKLPLKSSIKDGVGMGGVKLGMTEKKVRSKWGKPDFPCRSIPSSKLRVCDWSRGSGNKYFRTSVALQKKKVVYIYLFGSSKWKTKKGAKTGTHYSRLKKLYPKAKFTQTCVIDRSYVGEVGKKSGVTSFRFTTKKGAQQGVSGVDSIVIYDARKIDWDEAGAGAPKRPANHAMCNPRGVG
jgi:hypothetical protein